MERMEFAALLGAVRERAPLVQCITNMVTVNDCANILLAAGASATMAHHPLEVADAVAGVQALVLNLGAVGDREAMFIAGREANKLGVPVIFDPVAAGFTGLRRETARRLLEEIQFAVIRGNASEIRSLTEDREGGSGHQIVPHALVVPPVGGQEGLGDLLHHIAGLDALLLLDLMDGLEKLLGVHLVAVDLLLCHSLSHGTFLLNRQKRGYSRTWAASFSSKGTCSPAISRVTVPFS